MKLNKTTIFILLIMIGLTFLSCKEKKQYYYAYGSVEYFEKEKSLKINTNEAADLYAEYSFKENPDKNEVIVELDIIYEDDYIFSDDILLYNPKTGTYTLKNSIWINGKTREIQYIGDRMLKNINLKIPKEYFRKIYTK